MFFFGKCEFLFMLLPFHVFYSGERAKALGAIKFPVGNSLAVQRLGLPTFTCQGPRVPSLVGKPGSHKLCGVAKKIFFSCKCQLEVRNDFIP